MRSTLSRLPVYRPLGRRRYFFGRWPVLQGRRPRRGSRQSQRPLRVGACYKVLHLRPYVSDRFAPFYTKIIAANASEAPHVLDGLLHHESSLVIRESPPRSGRSQALVADGHADHGALHFMIGGDRMTESALRASGQPHDLRHHPLEHRLSQPRSR